MASNLRQVVQYAVNYGKKYPANTYYMQLVTFSGRGAIPHRW